MYPQKFNWPLLGLSLNNFGFCSNRYLYCLQLQQDIKEKRVVLDPTSDVAYKLVSLVLQAELGDFASTEHTAGYTHQYMQFLFENENEIVS